MAKKRSKSDKIRAKARLLVKKQVKQKQSLIPIKKSTEKQTVNYDQQLFAYDPRLILQDLGKTLIVTLIILVVLGLIILRYT